MVLGGGAFSYERGTPVFPSLKAVKEKHLNASTLVGSQHMCGLPYKGAYRGTSLARNRPAPRSTI